MNNRRILLASIAAATIIFLSELLQIRLSGLVDGPASLAFAGSWTAFVVASLGYGFFLASLSAVIRPRFGRWRALFGAGGALWLIGYILPALSILTLNLQHREVLGLPEAEYALNGLVLLAWGAAEVLAATGVAGWIIRGPGHPGAQPAPAR